MRIRFSFFLILNFSTRYDFCQGLFEIIFLMSNNMLSDFFKLLLQSVWHGAFGDELFIRIFLQHGNNACRHILWSWIHLNLSNRTIIEYFNAGLFWWGDNFNVFIIFYSNINIWFLLRKAELQNAEFVKRLRT
jgi:hypothetical protein